MPVVLKGISPRVTHRAAAGLLAVDLRSDGGGRDAFRRLQARAGEIGVALDGVYVQKMHRGGTELLVVGLPRPAVRGRWSPVGAGGGLTELIDDVVTERAPVDRGSRGPHAGPASHPALRRRRARARSPSSPPAAFIARFSELAATAPWPRFVFEVNPIKWTREAVVAVDGLLIVEGDAPPAQSFRRAPLAASPTRTPTQGSSTASRIAAAGEARGARWRDRAAGEDRELAARHRQRLPERLLGQRPQDQREGHRRDREVDLLADVADEAEDDQHAHVEQAVPRRRRRRPR